MATQDETPASTAGAGASTATATADSSYAYVTYGMLNKNHEFVDWVRVDLEEEDKARVKNANNNTVHDGDSFKDIDERAFEKFKAQWQDISVNGESKDIDIDTEDGAVTSISGAKTSIRGSIKLGKKLIASAGAKKLNRDSMAYGVFDENWNPVKLSPRYSNVDVAVLLHAAESNSTAANSSNDNNKNAAGGNESPKKRTYLTDYPNAGDGKLPVVPKRRSVQQQFVVKQSVQLFLGKNSIQFFACFPLQYSPRTIYRFDLVNGGIDRKFWQKMKYNQSLQQNKSIAGEKPTMSTKLIEMKSKMASNTTDLRVSLASKISTRKGPFFGKKSLLSNNSNIDGENDGKALLAETTEETPPPAKSKWKMKKMSFNATSMRNSFASKLSTTKKGSLLKKNDIANADADAGDSVDADENSPNVWTEEAAAKFKADEAASMSAKMSQMKLKMAENTSQMKLKMSENTENMKLKMAENTENMKLKMAENTDMMKLKMAENTNQMKLKMAENTEKVKKSFWSFKTKKSQEKKTAEEEKVDFEGEGGAKPSSDAIVAALPGSGILNFSIDDDDEDADAEFSGTPQTSKETSSSPSSPPSPSSPAGYVALTIDDVPCRFDDRSHSQLENVLDLLKRYDAQATFMVISSFLAECHEPDMIRLLLEGHELANHGVRDEAMDKMATSVETFVEALDECNSKITDLQTKANSVGNATVEIGVKWFRAPQARYTKIMEEGLAQRDMHNVMCDAYAACPIVEDGPWIATALSKQIRNGSIALLHMPEKCGFREHCLEAMELLLEDLQKRNFKVVTVGELHTLAEAQFSELGAGVLEPTRSEDSDDTI